MKWPLTMHFSLNLWRLRVGVHIDDPEPEDEPEPSTTVIGFTSKLDES